MLEERLKPTYPIRENVKHFEANIEVGPTGVKYDTKEFPRTQLKMGNNSALVQIGENYLTVNHLKPHSSWEDLREKTRSAWKSYVAEAKPAKITTAAVQYINKIEFQDHTITLEKFLQFYPHLGPGLHQTHGNFFVGVEWKVDGKNILRAELAPVPPGDKRALTLLLILIYKGRIDSLDEQQVFDWLDVAHNRIYETFIGMLTDESRRIFQEVH